MDRSVDDLSNFLSSTNLSINLSSLFLSKFQCIPACFPFLTPTPQPQNLLGFACLSVFLENTQRGPKTPNSLNPLFLNRFAPPFFAHPFFLFLPCAPPPFPRQFSSPKSCLSGTSDLLFLVEKRQPPEPGFWGRLWMGPPHRKKGKSFFSGVRKKVSQCTGIGFSKVGGVGVGVRIWQLRVAPANRANNVFCGGAHNERRNVGQGGQQKVMYLMSWQNVQKKGPNRLLGGGGLALAKGSQRRTIFFRVATLRFLGWHLCRTKSTRKTCNSKTENTKNATKRPRNFDASSASKNSLTGTSKNSLTGTFLNFIAHQSQTESFSAQRESAGMATPVVLATSLVDVISCALSKLERGPHLRLAVAVARSA